MSALAAYRALLANRPLSLLLGGEFVSAIGDWLYMVAILIVIYRETNDPVIVGLFGAAAGAAVRHPLDPRGYLADRLDRRLVLLGTDVFRGVCMLVMAWIVATDGPVAVLVLLAVLATCSSTFFYPAIGAYIPNLVRDERELGPANSLWATLDNLGYIIGPALGGILVAVGGAVFAFLANAATFLVIVAVLWRLPPSSNVAPPRRPAARPVAGAGRVARSRIRGRGRVRTRQPRPDRRRGARACRPCRLAAAVAADPARADRRAPARRRGPLRLRRRARDPHRGPRDRRPRRRRGRDRLPHRRGRGRRRHRRGRRRRVAAAAPPRAAAPDRRDRRRAPRSSS